MKKFSNKKSVMISGYYGFKNFGDEAVLSILVDKLKSMGTKITVLSKNPIRTANQYGVFSSLYWCSILIFLKMKKSDILISGGGSLLQDVTSLRSLFYYLWVIKIAKLMKKKVMIFAQGIGPINSKFGQNITKNILKKCDYICVRDKQSFELLKSWDITSELVCDPVFEIKVDEAQPQNIVGVQLRSCKNLTDDFLERLAKQVISDFSDKEIEIYSLQESLDLAVCQKFEQILMRLSSELKTNLVHAKTQDEIIKRISKLEYMIAMRFHANVIALKYGIKTLAINYDAKVENLALEANIPCAYMFAEEDLAEKFNQMKHLDTNKLLEFANSKTFDWSKIEQLIMQT